MRRLARRLLARGWTVHFVGVAPLEPSHPSLVFHPVRPRGGGHPSLQTLARCAWRASAVCLRERIRYLWSFGSAYAAILAPLRLLPRRRIVTFLRGSLVEQERAKGAGAPTLLLAGIVERAGARASDAVVAVSRELARLGGERASVLPNDVHAPAAPSDAEAARAEFSLPGSVFLAGYAGSISPVKSLETLLGAVARVPGAHLALLGFSRESAPYEGRIRGLVEELGLAPRAHLLDWAADGRRFLAALDVVVLPSRHEGCPNVLLEAMALGRPCLGARAAGIEEVLLHEELLFPHGDAATLAARLGRLKDDPAERERMGALARERAAAFGFDWEERAARIVEEAFGVGRA